MHPQGFGGIWGDIWGGVKKAGGWVWDGARGEWQQQGMPESGGPYPGGTTPYVKKPPKPPSGTPTGTMSYPTYDSSGRFTGFTSAVGGTTGVLVIAGLAALLLMSKRR